MFKRKGTLLIEVIEIMLIFIALSWFTKTYVFDFIQVQEKGMNPTFVQYNQLVVAKLLYTDINHLERGDIIAYSPVEAQENVPESLQVEHVKRLIGFPGEKVEIRNGHTYINGKAIYEPYTQNPKTYILDPVYVPDGHVFVLNDNRYEQTDSRTRGSVPIDNIKGKAIIRIWPISKFKII